MMAMLMMNRCQRPVSNHNHIFNATNRLRLLHVIAVAIVAIAAAATTATDAPPHPLAPYAVSLTDATFEHLTQASTGQTTGHWLIQFYSSGGGSGANDDPNNHHNHGLIIPSGEMYEEDEWLESNVVVASVDWSRNPLLRRRFAAHLPLAAAAAATTAADDAAAATTTWIYLHVQHGLLTMAGGTAVSWQALKQFCDDPPVGTGVAIPPPVTTTTSSGGGGGGHDNGDSSTSSSVVHRFLELFHQNAALSCLAFGLLGIRILVWLVRTYAGENAHKRVRLHHQTVNKKKQS